MKFFFTFFIVFILSTTCFSSEWEILPGIGKITIIESNHSMFPHPLRKNGHTYKDSLYSFKDHYADSSVAVFLSENYHPSETVDFVFYFHG